MVSGPRTRTGVLGIRKIGQQESECTNGEAATPGGLDRATVATMAAQGATGSPYYDQIDIPISELDIDNDGVSDLVEHLALMNPHEPNAGLFMDYDLAGDTLVTNVQALTAISALFRSLTFATLFTRSAAAPAESTLGRLHSTWNEIVTSRSLTIADANRLIVAAFSAGRVPMSVIGDPHLETLDGFGYDLQSVGEFTLLQADDYLNLQARFTPAGPSVSRMDIIAMWIAGDYLEIGPNLLLWNGQPLDLSVDESALLDGGTLVSRTADGYFIAGPAAPGSEPVMLLARRNNISVVLPEGVESRGLLGNNNGYAFDDLALPDGTPVPFDVSEDYLHGGFADAWRITDDESLFTYPDGHSTATYTDLNFPAHITRLSDFTNDEISTATETCQTAGVATGPQMDRCVFDILVTGDHVFAQTAALAVSAAHVWGAPRFDANGSYSSDFQSDIPRTFANAGFAEIEGDTMVGPVRDTTGYSFFLPTLPDHRALTLAVDLTSVGDLSDGATITGTIVNAEPREFTVQINADGSATSTLGTVTLTGQGVLSDGQPWITHRLSVEVEHSAPELDVQFATNGYVGLKNTALYLDDVAITAPPIPPIAMPASATGSYSATLTEAGESHQYTLTVPEAGLLFTPQGAEQSTTVALTGPTGDTQVLTIALEPGTTRWLELPAGQYTATVRAQDHTSAGAYTFDLVPAPSPELFSYQPDTAVSDGQPAAGAGNLETIVSADAYTFTTSVDAAYLLDIDGSISPTYTLTNSETGDVIATGRTDHDLNLPAGTYTLTFADRSLTGTYGFTLVTLPAYEHFSYTLGNYSSSASTGAGRLTNPYQVERWEFTVPESSTYEIDFTWGPILDYRIVDPTSGETIHRADGSLQMTLAAGTYYLEFGAVNGNLGPAIYTGYTFLLHDADHGEYTIGTTTTSDPSTGLGILEHGRAIDRYTFTITTAGDYFMSGNRAWVLYTIRDEAGAAVGPNLSMTTRTHLQPGTYTIEAYSPSLWSGNYTFTFFKAENPQYFDYTIGTTVSNGVPAEGAGNIESRTSLDNYVFTLTTPTTLNFQYLSGSRNYWLYREGSSTQVAVFTYTGSVSLSPGTYSLRVGHPLQLAVPGTYSFKLTEAVPAQTALHQIE